MAKVLLEYDGSRETGERRPGKFDFAICGSLGMGLWQAIEVYDQFVKDSEGAEGYEAVWAVPSEAG
jgi:hypothetical protein